ncbi:MAG TPA: acetyl-CoA decarbonylase/synthase complex subunit gamma [Candidatus Brocadiia bacterium]|nr:acetyl-CoA decarbonylase/synthase complex subunit gamma [Planctomycetota bacterium]MDO8094207.1 acetyl-CoA decarbonylase/synthase complex subunit gamma [Candidatus Brocadiales bacterium]
MALTGLEIFKLLPKTNCKKCGRPTCLAFAMQLAQKKANLTDCPDVSEEAKNVLGAASAPPIKLITLKAGEKIFKVGEETVLYRHEEKFHNPTGVGVTIRDDLDGGAFSERLKKIDGLKFTRVGTEIGIDIIAVQNMSKNVEKFSSATKMVADNSHLALILMSDSVENMRSALDVCGNKRPLLWSANAQNYEGMARLAKEKNCPLIVSAPRLEELADLTEKIKSLGVSEMILDYNSARLKDVLQGLTKVRRAALKKNFRPLGFSTITYVKENDGYQEIIKASTYLAKYAGIVVLDVCEPWQIMPLLTVRQNIFTDPQKPVQVEPKLYQVGQANENSPLLFTTNFSLTYYTVEGEVEASRTPAYILAVDTEGTSVLTAYSGDKLNEKVVAKAMANAKVEEKIKHKKLIIPGLVAVMTAKLKEELGWEILVGPKEASGIPSYLRSTWS